MTIRDIVLHADASLGFQSRARLAAHLASQSAARLTAIHSRPRGAQLRAEFATPGMLLENYNELYWGYERKSKQILTSECQPLNVDFEWIRENRDPTRTIQYYSRLTDLVILGSEGYGESSDTAAIDASDIVIATQRPCLIVPEGLSPDWRAAKVAIAWNDSNESANAVREAENWITNADSIQVVCVADEHTQTGDLERHLNDRGTVPAIHRFGVAKGRSVAEAIVQWCESEKVDLLIQGAYGHTRSYEFVFGGVTEYMVKWSPIPVLMVY